MPSHHKISAGESFSNSCYPTLPKPRKKVKTGKRETVDDLPKGTLKEAYDMSNFLDASQHANHDCRLLSITYLIALCSSTFNKQEKQQQHGTVVQAP